METPRGERCRLYLIKHIASVALALSAILVRPCAAQVESGRTGGAGDSAATVPRDSTRPDSAARVATDSGGATAGTDSAGQRAVRPDSTGAAPVQPVPPPVDSVLAAACKEGRSAPHLLIVAFRRTSTPAERAAVAREVGGTLLGMTVYSTPPGWFLRIPGSANERSVADRLIALAPVLGVSTTRCP